MADAEVPEPVETDPVLQETEAVAVTPEPVVTPPSAQTKGTKGADEAMDIVKTVVYALAIALVLRIFLFQPFTIPSGSMIPNLAVGDYIIVSKFSYGYSKHSVPLSPPIFKGRILAHQPKRGDIVVFMDTKDNRTAYVKRLIGLPGDRIQVLDGVAYVNGKMMPQKALPRTTEDKEEGVTRLTETLPEGKVHTLQDTSPRAPWDNTDVYLVPENNYFMMGDNRDNSADSRVPKSEGGIDFVPAENLIGKAQIILFSWREGVSLFKPWTWVTKARPSRALHMLH
jgi:signal peptidase I